MFHPLMSSRVMALCLARELMGEDIGCEDFHNDMCYVQRNNASVFAGLIRKRVKKSSCAQSWGGTPRFYLTQLDSDL